MSLRIRLSRGGAKKRPFYRIVIADSRMPRDGRFIEKLGTYNPLLPKDDEKRVIMNMDRIKYWLDLGAKPTDRIQRMLEADGTLPKTTRNNPQKAIAGKAAQERTKAKAEKWVKEYEKWKDDNPGKSYDDFLKEMGLDRIKMNAGGISRKALLDMLKKFEYFQHKIQQKHIINITNRSTHISYGSGIRVVCLCHHFPRHCFQSRS